MIYIIAAIIAIVVLGICITRKPYVDDNQGVSGGAGNGVVEKHEDDKDNEDELER